MNNEKVMITRLNISRSIIWMLIILFAFSSLAQAQEVENEYQSRVYAEMSYKPVKKLKLKLNS